MVDDPDGSLVLHSPLEQGTNCAPAFRSPQQLRPYRQPLEPLQGGNSGSNSGGNGGGFSTPIRHRDHSRAGAPLQGGGGTSGGNGGGISTPTRHQDRPTWGALLQGGPPTTPRRRPERFNMVTQPLQGGKPNHELRFVPTRVGAGGTSAADSESVTTTSDQSLFRFQQRVTALGDPPSPPRLERKAAALEQPAWHKSRLAAVPESSSLQHLRHGGSEPALEQPSAPPKPGYEARYGDLSAASCHSRAPKQSRVPQHFVCSITQVTCPPSVFRITQP